MPRREESDSSSEEANEEAEQPTGNPTAPGPRKRTSDVALPVDAHSQHNYQLSVTRIVQRNLAYIVGMPADENDVERLRSEEMFGKYGKALKLVVSSPSVQSTQNPTIGMYARSVRSNLDT